VTLPTSTRSRDAGRIPGTVFIPTAIEVDLLWNITGGKQVKNVMHGIVAGGFAATTAIAQAVYASIIASGAWTTYHAFVNAGCSLAGVALRDIRGPNVLPLVTSTGAATPGSGAGLALAAGVSAVVKQSTALAGRGGRGRLYLPGLDSTSLNANTGNFSAAFQTAANAFVAQVGTSLTASGITMAVANPARQQFVGRTGTTHAARAAGILAVTASTMLLLTPRSQRRRSYIA
jgi:hypothetical protein